MNMHYPPRGLLAVYANERRGAANILSELSDTFDDFKERQLKRVTALEAAVDDLAVTASARELGAGHRGLVDPKYTGDFMAWVKAGENESDLRVANKTGRLAEIQAAMSVGTAGDGGYLAPNEWDRTIVAAGESVSPIRRLATVVRTGTQAFTKLWDTRAWGSGWVGETALRPETSTTTLTPIPFSAGEIYANPAVTQRLLDDAEIDVANYIISEIGAEFGRQEALAFVAGSGTNKPFGFLTYATGGTNAAVHPGGAIQVTTVASATAITGDELLDVVYALPAPYRTGAVWLMNSTTAAKIRKLKDGSDAYLWQMALSEGQPPNLLGFPVEFDENMPNATAGALPIAFGNFRYGYLVNDRMGTRVLRDPYSSKPYVMFYTTRRVGGGVLDPKALRVIKMAAS